MQRRAVAVGQLCSSIDKAANLATCTALAQQARERGAALLALPEAFEFMGRPSTADSLQAAEALDGPTMSGYRDIARRFGLWMSLGGFHELLPDSKYGGKIANTHVILNSQGEVVDTYRKIHLFDVDYDGGYKESDSTVRGDRLVVVPNTPIGTLGVTTCYDIRFPHMYSALRDRGCDVLLAPSAFMPTTGLAHWHVLMRARAIETQCYFVAAAQAGKHNLPSGDALSGRVRESFGHSLVVGPFGNVLTDLGTEVPALDVIDIDLDEIQQVRAKMPIQQHRHTAMHIFDQARETEK
mmetsp:Transcript_26810/g.85309  ORF Transcript_26810/g.85309 Transcript_26810/m.85309 type:complete len:296 (-) Transcript_26810:1415-2302(-)